MGNGKGVQCTMKQKYLKELNQLDRERIAATHPIDVQIAEDKMNDIKKLFEKAGIELAYSYAVGYYIKPKSKPPWHYLF